MVRLAVADEDAAVPPSVAVTDETVPTKPRTGRGTTGPTGMVAAGMGGGGPVCHRGGERSGKGWGGGGRDGHPPRPAPPRGGGPREMLRPPRHRRIRR